MGAKREKTMMNVLLWRWTSWLPFRLEWFITRPVLALAPSVSKTSSFTGITWGIFLMSTLYSTMVTLAGAQPRMYSWPSGPSGVCVISRALYLNVSQALSMEFMDGSFCSTNIMIPHVINCLPSESPFFLTLSLGMNKFRLFRQCGRALCH